MTYTSFEQWERCYPEAAAALFFALTSAPLMPEVADAKTEADVQANERLSFAKQGAYSWRNNVGVTPDKCSTCGARCQPVRYGLANDSKAVNQRTKSSDLILAIPRVITPDMVGRTIAQFGGVETKHPGWVPGKSKREGGQAAWLALLNKIGGYGQFSTGGLKL